MSEPHMIVHCNIPVFPHCQIPSFTLYQDIDGRPISFPTVTYQAQDAATVCEQGEAFPTI